MTSWSKAKNIVTAATLGLALAASAVPAEAQFRGGFPGGFMARPMMMRPAFHGGLVHRPFMRTGFVHRPFLRTGFVHRPFLRTGFVRRPFFVRRHRFPVGAFAAGLIGGAALGTLAVAPAYATPVVADFGPDCFLVRRKFITAWGDIVIRRRWVCT